MLSLLKYAKTSWSACICTINPITRMFRKAQESNPYSIIKFYIGRNFRSIKGRYTGRNKDCLLQLAKRFHPDVNKSPNANDHFAQINK